MESYIEYHAKPLVLIAWSSSFVVDKLIDEFAKESDPDELSQPVGDEPAKGDGNGDTQNGFLSNENCLL